MAVHPPVLLYGRTAGGDNIPILVDASGHIVTTGGSPNPFDQNLNTSDSPTFANVTIKTAGALRPDTTTAHTLLIQGYDVDGTAYKTFITITNGNTPDMTIAAPAGGTLVVQPSTYKSSDGSAGISTTVTTASLVGKTITFKDGLVTSFA